VHWLVALRWEWRADEQGVLELEAAVQADPTNRDAWYALGLKQQENEREGAAILALSKVVQLDPDYRPAYLALGVSYTNEGEMEAANTMLERWIELASGRQRGSGGAGEIDGQGWQAAQKRLVERLIDIARLRPEEVDAEVQVALGVLFNASEEWEKAEDCFMAALSVRPDVSDERGGRGLEGRADAQDWLLYNRLGATLANGGRSNEAVAYYYKALELHPNFVRAL
jgi:peroxin-5